MPTMPEGYYNRFDPTKNYDAHLFRAGYVLQSAELNEVQDQLAGRVQRMGDALFKDGAIIRDAKLIIDSETGDATGESGAVYLKGQVRGVPSRTFTVPTTGTVAVGIYLIETVVSELEDPALRDPAIGVRNYQEPGASRLQAIPQWGYSGDAQTGEFYPIYQVEDGILIPNLPPPSGNAVSLAISNYDRQSAGGYYVVSGMNVSQLPDNGEIQVYSIQEGTARVNGVEVELPNALRNEYPVVVPTQTITSEPHLATTSPQRVNLSHSPVESITSVTITAEKTVTLTHGAYTGVLDALPDTAILSIIDVHQGGTTYAEGSDYRLTTDKVDWSLGGAEVAPGSSYSVTYRYQTTVTPSAVDSTGCTVTGAVTGTLIQVTYLFNPPRIDRLCLDMQGRAVWIQGVPHLYAPAMPATPSGVLPLATVYQTWTADRTIESVATRVVTMSALERMQTQISDLYSLVADQRLLNNALATDPTAKRGVFVDPFIDQDMRDSGVTQTAAIVDQELTLGITEHVVAVSLNTLSTPIPEWVGLPRMASLPVTLTVGTPAYLITQTLRTDSMAINPYMAFSPLPAGAMLTPAVDFWTEETTTWKPDSTALVVSGNLTAEEATRGAWWINWYTNGGFRNWSAAPDLSWWILVHTGQTIVPKVEAATIRTAVSTAAPNLRQISVAFTLTGFGPGELLNTVKFDGVSVAFTA